MDPLETRAMQRFASTSNKTLTAAQLRPRAVLLVPTVSLDARRTLAIGLAALTWLMVATMAVWCAAQPPATAPPRPSQPGGARPVTPPATAPNPGAKPGAKPGATATTAPRPGARPGAKKPAKPTMKSLELVTKDGVKLRAFYFPSDKGKEAIPVIVMHEWQGQAGPYAPLVKSLWDVGCAVIVPEFRGHGGSREQEFAGRTREFDVNRMGKADVLNMMTGDLEAVKKFLVEENNAEKLNLNALTLIGIREGAILASHWAIRDLNFPSVGAIKQGQDVKAIVLISPERTLKGFTLDETLADRYFWQLPFLIVVGQSSRQASDTERFHKRLETLKKRAARGEATGLQYEEIATSLDGHALIDEAPDVIDKVKAFVVNEMIRNSSRIPWIERP